MPTAFDTAQYTTNYNPIAGGPFVSIQDVMSSFGDVFQEVIQLLPELVSVLEQLNPAQIIQLLEVGLQDVLNLLFPTDGSTSPLITAIINALTGANSGGLGNLLPQLENVALTILPQIFSSIESLLLNPGNLLSGFVGGGTSILTQLIGAGGGSGSTLGAFGSLFGGLGPLSTLLTGFSSGVPLLSQLPSLLVLPLTGVTGLSGLLSGFDITGSIPLLSQLPSLLTLPISAITGLLGAGGLLTGFTSGIPILSQLIGLFPGTTTGLSGLTGLGAVITDFMQVIGSPTGLGSGNVALPGIGSIPLLSGLFGGGGTTFLTSLIPALPISLIIDLPSELASLLPISTWQGLLDGVLGTASGTGTTGGFQNFLTGLLPISGLQGIIDGAMGGTNNPFSAFSTFLSGTHSTANNANTNAVNALGQLASLATGLLGAGNGIPQVVTWLLSLSGLASGANSLSLLNQGNLQSIIDGVLGGTNNPFSAFISFLQGTLTQSSPLNALNIFGLIPAGNVGLVGVSQIGNASPNLLTNPNFQGAGALDGAGMWFQDATVGYGGLLGSAKTTANGTTKDLLSNAVSVTAGQVVNLSGWAQWTSLVTNPGTQPIQIAVNAYNAGSLVSQTVIATLAGSPATSTWQNLAGSFTVPSGVDTVHMALHVTADATAGNVWFTNLNLNKTGLLPTNLIKDLASGNPLDVVLSGFQGNITTLFGNFANVPTLTQFNGLLNVFGGSNSAAQSMVNGFLNGSSIINGGNIQTGSVPLGVLPDLQVTLDHIVTNLQGLSGSGFSTGQANTALANHAAALTAVQADVATLKTAQTAGVSVGEAFTDNGTSSTSPGSNWYTILSASNAGHFGTPSGNSCSWVSQGISACDAVEIWQGTNPQSVTDLQTATIILSNTGGNFLGATGYNDIWLRVGSASTTLANITGIRFRWGADGSLSIDRFVNGVLANLNTAPAGTITAPGASVSLTATAGTAGNARFFNMFVNSQSVMSIAEIGSGSLLGTGYRGWGFGGHASGLLLPPSQQAPATIHQFTAADQAAA